MQKGHPVPLHHAFFHFVVRELLRLVIYDVFVVVVLLLLAIPLEVACATINLEGFRSVGCLSTVVS